jgi:hypothetical protein
MIFHHMFFTTLHFCRVPSGKLALLLKMAHEQFVDLPITNGDFPVRKRLTFTRGYITINHHELSLLTTIQIYRSLLTL